ncbi:uncharacterized protein LOC136711408 isoform X2 [Amia ocellicauda]|uniref:uncharacterized protein LOC136711408 isoform X2 n=1 Tax=Amia ocellicauda TaxID=2972642 RepID=UPI0034642B34
MAALILLLIAKVCYAMWVLLSNHPLVSAGMMKGLEEKSEQNLVPNLSLFESYMNTDRPVTLKADNGMFWCSVDSGSKVNNVEAVKSVPDEWCHFRVSKAHNGKILLRDKRGVYLSRINYGGIGGVDYIQAAKSEPDVFCEFEVFVDNGNVILKADNGKYLSRIERYGKQNLEAAKDVPDEFCRFVLGPGDSVGPIQNLVPNLSLFESYMNTDRPVTLKADNGMFWCSVDSCSKVNNVEAVKSVPDEWCHFKVSKAHNGKILLRDKRGVYLSRINYGGIGGVDYIQAAKSEPDVFCEFEVFVDNGNVILKADNGKYLSRIERYGKQNLEAAKDVPDEFCRFVLGPGDSVGPIQNLVPNLSLFESYMNTDRPVTLKADNGMFWCSVDSGSKVNNVEAVKSVPDEWCHFKVSKAHNGKILLRDKRGVYLSRINYGGIGGVDYIQAAKSEPDVFCEFEVFVDNGNVILKADNGKYLSRIERYGKQNIEAAKDVPDQFCRFVLSPGDSEGPTQNLVPNLSLFESYMNTDRPVTLKADNGMFWCSVDSGPKVNNVEAVKSVPDEWCHFKVLKAHNGKILLRDKRGVYLSRINYGGIGGVDYIQAAKSEPDVFCEFEVFVDNGNVILKADNGKYLSRIERYGKQNLEAAKDVPDEFCRFVLGPGDSVGPIQNLVPNLSLFESYMNTDRPVTLKADNGMFWCSVDSGSKVNNVEAVKSVPDEWCHFKVSKAHNGKILLRDKRGVYLSRINYGGIGGVDFIQAAKSEPDVFCEFEVFVDNGNVILKADNGKYLSRIERYGKQNLEAAKDVPDEFCRFVLGPGDSVGPIQNLVPNLSLFESYMNTDRPVTLKADNGMFWCSVDSGSKVNNVEAVKSVPDEWCHFKVSKAHNGKILLRDKRGVYLSRINYGGIGGVDYIQAAKSEPDVFCEFEVFVDNGNVILRADNGKYLSRIERYGKQNIEAAKDVPDQFCRFLL